MSFFNKMIEIAKSMGVKNFAFYKKWALDHLKKQLDEEETVTKALEYCEEYLEKAYGVGTIREWKGKKYIKGPDKKWRRYYEKHGRGANQAIKSIMRQINALEDGDVEGLYAIIQKNQGRFRDGNGNVLPEVQQIHDLVDKKQSGSEKQNSDIEKYKKLQDELKQEIADGKRNNTKELQEDVNEWKNLLSIAEKRPGSYSKEQTEHFREIIKIGEAELSKRKEGKAKKEEKKDPTKEITEGSVVRFKENLEPGDENWIGVVLEDRGDTVVVQDVQSKMTIKPQHDYSKKDLVISKDAYKEREEELESEINTKIENYLKEEKQKKDKELNISDSDINSLTDIDYLKDLQKKVVKENNRLHAEKKYDEANDMARRNYVISDRIKQLESEQEKHQNRSNAMKGNQNAKKDGDNEEEQKDVKNIITPNTFKTSKHNTGFTGDNVSEEERKENLKSKNPIKIEISEYSGLSEKEAKNLAKDKYKKLKEVDKDGIHISFPMSGFNETKQHIADKNVLYVLGKMDEIIKTGVFMYKEENTDPKKINTLNMINYANKVDIDNKDYYVRALVKEDINGNFYYDNDSVLVESVENKKGESEARTTVPNGSAHQSSPNKNRITQWLTGVNEKINNKHDKDKYGIKKSFLDQIEEISKSVKEKSQPEQKHDLEYYKKWAMSILDKQKEEPEEDGPNEETIVKALAYTEMIAKAGYPVGTIREWKGQKYIKIAPNKWKPKYDNMGSRGAKMSLSNLKKAVAKCNSEEELYNLINSNASRFRDENGHPFPEVQELHDMVTKRQGELENIPKDGAEELGNKNTTTGKENGSGEVTEKEDKKKGSVAEKISQIQKLGKKAESTVEKLGNGNVDGVAEDAGNDTVNAVKTAAKDQEKKKESVATQEVSNMSFDEKTEEPEEENFDSLTEKYNATKDPDERESILNKIMALQKEKNDTIKDMKEQRKEDLTQKYSETTDPDEREKILNEMMNLDRQDEEKILPAMFDKEDEGFDAWDKDQKAKYGDKSVEELQKLLDTKYKNVKKYTPEYSEAMKIGDMIQQKKRQKK